MMKKTVRDIDFKNKRALVRVDFNVPMKDGKITDDFRIKSALKTIDYLMDQGAKVVLMSHLGRPKGTYKPEFSLKPVAEKLEELTGKKVVFFDIESPVNEDTLKASKDFDGSILLLQNTRYDAGEEKNDPELAKKFAEHGDIYVNDAFGTAHRAHASNVGVSQILPAVAGFLVENEIKYIKENLDNPKHPFVAILGGAKVSDKIGVIENLMNKVDKIIIGGAMANTFLKAQGYDMGKSLVEDEKIDLAKDLLKESADKNVEILLPLDLVMTDSLDDSKVIKTLKLDDDKVDLIAVDIGEETIKIFSQAIGHAKLVIWNGPMGVFENKDFAKGTFEIARAVAENSGVSIIGGGDSSLAVKLSGYEDKVTHVSTGGGASLEMMEGKELPGIKCLEEA
ncbi:phosphoglycerate kinase [uncultured Ezakiella sp.]|uniref:phosphoglycerate kinase n=1 Tax=uncultured Ezakiella sp. TaxID=1637529 RepID=UPI0025E1BEA2|nr:phosphoglycerate kinase [uncultured Ezakiella sp.]